MKKRIASLIYATAFALPLTAITTDAVAQNATQDPFKPATQSQPLEKKSAHKVGTKAKAKAQKAKLHAGTASKAKAHAGAKSKSKAGKVAKHKAKKSHMAQTKSKHSNSKTHKTV